MERPNGKKPSRSHHLSLAQAGKEHQDYEQDYQPPTLKRREMYGFVKGNHKFLSQVILAGGHVAGERAHP